jgi:hypothetical protein
MTTLKRATIKTYTAGTHRADVQIAGSLSVWLDGIPVATDIPAAEVVAGRECAVLFFTDDSPADAVIIAVYGAAPAAPSPTGITVQEGDTTVDAAATTLDFTEPDAVLVTSSPAGEANVAMNLYTLLLGRSTPQTIHGGTATNNSLTLKGTSHGTPGTAKVIVENSDFQMLTNGKRFLNSAGNERLRFQTVNPELVLTGSTHVTGISTLSAGGFGVNLSPNTFAFLRSGVGSGSNDGYIAGLFDNGATTGAISGQCIGVAGRAIANDATITALGLDYIAGATQSIPDAYGVRTQCLATGSGVTIDNYIGYQAKGGVKVLASVTNWYGFRATDVTGLGATNYYPFYEDVADTGDSSGNRFRSNTMFGSTTGAFGGGDGVIGIRNAATNPGSNPSNGGVLYAEAGALKWRGSGGTVTTIAPA